MVRKFICAILGKIFGGKGIRIQFYPVFHQKNPPGIKFLAIIFIDSIHISPKIFSKHVFQSCPKFYLKIISKKYGPSKNYNRL